MTRTSQTLDADDTLRLLAPRRRRVALEVLREHTEGVVDLATLAGRVHQRCEPAAVSGSLDELQIRLHHADLPKLDAVGVVSYDPAVQRVQYRGHSGIEALLDTLAAGFE